MSGGRGRPWRGVDAEEGRGPLSLSFSHQGGGKSFPEAPSRLPLHWPGLGHTEKLISGIEGGAKSVTAHPRFVGRERAVRKSRFCQQVIRGDGGANIT